MTDEEFAPDAEEWSDKPCAKVAIDAHVIEGRPQGSQTVLIGLLRAIAAIGESRRFAIYCSDPDLCRSRIGVDGFDYVQIPPSGSFARLFWTLPQALRRNDARAVLWQYIVSPLYWKKNIVVIHDILPFTHPHLFPLFFRVRCQILFYLSMWMSWKIIAVSETAKGEIQRLFPRFADRLEIVRNGPSFPRDVYFKEAAPLASDGRRSYLLSVGRIEHRKNVPLLVDAFLAAGLSDIDLIVIGNRDLGFAEEIRRADNVILLENVPNDTLIRYYREADLFVYPSAAEGFGLPLLDAVLFGLPVIASDRTSMPEVGGEIPTYFDPLASDAKVVLTGLIREHFTDRPIVPPSLEARMSHYERFNWQNGAKNLTEIVTEILD